MFELLLGIAVVAVAIYYVLRPVFDPGVAETLPAQAGDGTEDSGEGPAGARTCPRCGPRPEAGAVYCARCGRRLGAAAPCRRCGARLAVDALFCADCGARVAA
jgi:ribosomal protein L40E